MDSENMTAHVQLSELYVRSGEIVNSIKQCELALRIQPTCKEAVLLLADGLQRKMQNDEVLPQCTISFFFTDASVVGC